MGRFQRFLCLWVDRPLDVIVLDSMNGINEIEVAFAMLLLSTMKVSSQCTATQETGALTPEISDRDMQLCECTQVPRQTCSSG